MIDFATTKKRTGALAPNITPLIDVVFILLIFFMLTSTFRKDVGIDVALPQSTSAEQKASKEESMLLTITINKSGDVFVEEQQVDFDGLDRRVKAFLTRFDDGLIMVRSDGEAHVQTLVSVMDRLRDTQAANVTIATTDPKPSR